MDTPSLFPEFDDIIQFVITDTEPTTLLRDFAAFTGLLKEKPVALTKSRRHIPGKLLHRMNAAMSQPWPDTTTRTPQHIYPILHFFYHLALAGGLFRQCAGKGGRLNLLPSPRLEEYEELSPPERYFFLLETLWMDTDWQDLCEDRHVWAQLMDVQSVMSYLSRRKPGRPIALGRDRPAAAVRALDIWDLFLVIFSHLGFWDIVPASGPEESRWPSYMIVADAIIPSPFGLNLAGILANQRDIRAWNLPRRREFGQYDTGFSEPFFQPFVPLIPSGQLEKTLPRGKTFTGGTYVFKVALGKDLWRRIEMSAGDTLLHLHRAIQQAFGFDDDHLYSFYMDGKRWSKKRFVSPWEDSGPSVEKARIGEIGLFVGQEILYLFDYGDSWHFWITLEDIRTGETRRKGAVVTEEKGAAPEQYGP